LPVEIGLAHKYRLLVDSKVSNRNTSGNEIFDEFMDYIAFYSEKGIEEQFYFPGIFLKVLGMSRVQCRNKAFS
jgi:hypothetical protein